MSSRVSTGISGIDQVIDYLRPGDNVVWQLNDIEDYKRIVLPYVQQALLDDRQIIYVRFASHSPLLEDGPEDPRISLHQLKADDGFEKFTTNVYNLITKTGRKAFYVFDCLSDLLDQWSSDLMIGNFFRITCPYLFELDTVAYFALKRGSHSFDTIARIRDTTQLLIDLYHKDDLVYIHPLKVWQRYSTTMFMPHKMEEGQLIPITNSAEVAGLFSGANQLQYQSARQIDFWDRLFLEADQLTTDQVEERQAVFERLSDLLIGGEGRIGQLSRQYFDLQDILNIKGRQIGTGKIGGKSVGMLLSRKIMEQSNAMSCEIKGIDMEPHDSFYLGADLFYTYIVQNDCWKLRMEQKTAEGYYNKAHELQEKLLQGNFPASIREQLQQMMDYFGQAPIIVRSSSLLEDDFGNAFAGKYESVFCANQGSPEERYETFEQAVRTVYASMLDENALSYRQKRGLQEKDEQMALLVQRVSGSYHGRFFYPLLAGVGNSNNLYVWNNKLDPHAGMLRLVFGLGTRAVDRVEGDYPRIVALDQPLLSSHESREAENTYSQHFVDVIDLEENELLTFPVEKVTAADPNLNLSDVGEIDWEQTRQLAAIGMNKKPQWILNFKKLLSDKPFVNRMQSILKTLEKAYDYPVDIEFAINPISKNQMMINLLQCRPLQTRRIGPGIAIPENIDIENTIIQSKGRFMGGNVQMTVKYIIYVIPEKYVELADQDQYQIARLIGQLNRLIANTETSPTMLLGPGRWGTSTPSLGIPVRFSEINNISALGEVAFVTAGMIPEISYGSHFFQDLVESNIFYMALLPHEKGCFFDPEKILARPNLFKDLLPQQATWASVIHVCEFSDDMPTLYSDIKSQTLLFAAPQLLVADVQG